MQLETALKPSEAEYVRLIKRAAELVGCAKNSPDDTELAAITAKLDAYEANALLQGMASWCRATDQTLLAPSSPYCRQSISH